MTQHEWREKFSDRLIYLVNERNMKAAKLAEYSNLSRSRISDYIHARATPNIFAVINIAYALDIPVSELIDFDERICE